MRRLLPLLFVLGCALLVTPAASSDHGLTNFGKRFASGELGTFPPPAPAAARNFTVLGHHDLGGGGFNADVYEHAGFAYVGVWGAGPEGCPATGVKVVDVRLPIIPRLVGILQNPAMTTAEDVVVMRVDTPSFRGDLAVTGIQTCDGESFRGLQLFDVTNPRQPRELGRWSSPGGGCHEIDVAVRQDQKVLAACATPFAELSEGAQEVHLVDVTNPMSPAKVGGFGLIAALGEEQWLAFGCFPASFAHSVRFFDRGTILYASYWDGGTLRFDVSNPASPALRARAVTVPPDEDGDNHSMALGNGGNALLINPEDFSPIDEVFGFCEGDFDGWGDLQIWDNTNPMSPTPLAQYATPNAASKSIDGFYSIHNTEAVGTHAFASWYSDGIRWLDLADPAHPVERGFFVPPGAADPNGFFPPVPIVWGVWPMPEGLFRTGPLILASDINSGLWIIRPTGRR